MRPGGQAINQGEQFKVAMVAQTAKTARIARALLRSGEDHRDSAAAA
jgi:hypothetical protein